MRIDDVIAIALADHLRIHEALHRVVDDRRPAVDLHTGLNSECVRSNGVFVGTTQITGRNKFADRPARRVSIARTSS